MLNEIHGAPAHLDAKTAEAKVSKGKFSGKTVGEVITNAQKEDLEAFFSFVMSNRSYFVGHSYSLPWLYRRWVELGTPAE